MSEGAETEEVRRVRKSLGDLAVMVSKQTGVSEEEAREQVESVVSAIIEVLEEGDTLTVQNFGRFELRYRGPRRYRHFSGQHRMSRGRTVVRFRPARKFVESVQ